MSRKRSFEKVLKIEEMKIPAKQRIMETDPTVKLEEIFNIFRYR
jgi:hypothetical protein